MKKNLLWKVVVILATLVIFVWGVFLGTDPQKSLDAIKAHGLLAGLQQNIHLGLDLKGGTHLILQVQVNDAVNADTDQAVERLKDDLKRENVAYGDITKPDAANHPEQIVLKGVPNDAVGGLRKVVQERYADYDMTSAGDNWVLTMKQQVLRTLKDRAVTQAIETIRNRIDQLGVSEPIIQEHGLGEYQILVQLPGVDDPARVKDIMQSTAMLEIRLATDQQPYPSEQAALAAHGGVLPPDSVIVKGKTQSAGNGGEPV
ncbi:MAG TPA: protein translocase subunit SecD, partial [candidate division Zixibacteria bacterium]|nr:protein translocase subunit SecD [candidate division Zixibacteria bacterium]